MLVEGSTCVEMFAGGNGVCSLTAETVSSTAHSPISSVIMKSYSALLSTDTPSYHGRTSQTLLMLQNSKGIPPRRIYCTSKMEVTLMN